MKEITRILSSFVGIALLLCAIQSVHAENQPPVNNGSMSRDIDPVKFLQEPFDRKTLFGTFDGFASSLYAFKSKLQVYGDKAIVNREVHDIYPDFYKPTVKEILDMVAWQTGSRWKFDQDHYQYEFIEYPIIYPFTINLSKGWQHQYRGMYVWFAPQGSPVGMDIYYFGHVTPPKGKDPIAFYRDMRKFYSTLVLKAHGLKSIPDPDKDMVELTIAGNPALYWQPDKNFPGFSKEPGMSNIWRQWSVIIDGNAFLIVSAMDESSRDKVWNDVDEIQQTFALNKNFNLERNYEAPKISKALSDMDLSEEALDLSTTLQPPESLKEVIFVPVRTVDYKKYKDDKDLGPFVAVAETDKYDAVVLTLLDPSAHNIRALFFRENNPVFYADTTSDKPRTIKEIRASLQKLPANISKYRLHFGFVEWRMTADDGTPIHTYKAEYIKAQPHPCNTDGSPDVCLN